jgi:tRNA (guanine37-N1)-methyltransferase
LRAVAVDDGVRGELRVRSVEVVSGEGPLVTVHREHGMELRVDLERAYFSPRLATEHRRVADMVMPGDRVLDMFTGVGPFAVLMAKAEGVAEVHAVDLNPAAARLARENAEVNGVASIVTVHSGDAREVVPTLGAFDRIVMNHPHDAVSFLDVAMGASAPGTRLHLYVIGTDGEARAALGSADDRASEQGLPGVRLERTHQVRTYAPGVSHWCLDLVVRA